MNKPEGLVCSYTSPTGVVENNARRAQRAEQRRVQDLRSRGRRLRAPRATRRRRSRKGLLGRSPNLTVGDSIGKQQVQYLNTQTNLGTLASLATIVSDTQIDATREQGSMLKKLKGTWRMNGLTVDEGPIYYGFCTGMDATQVTQAFAADPQSDSDLPDIEHGNRALFPVGLWDDDTEHTYARLQPQVWHSYRFPWKKIKEGQALSIFAHNAANATLTTGAIMSFDGVAVTEWLDD